LPPSPARLRFLSFLKSVSYQPPPLSRKPAAEITLGEVVRATEPGFDMAECFRRGENHCRLTPVCQLKGILGEATRAFLDKLDSYTLSELVADRAAVLDALATPTASATA